MSKTGKPDDGMKAMFAAARTHAPEPDADFLARVLGDAEAVQAGFAERAGDMASASASAAAARLYPAPARGLRGVFAALGGWPAVAGLGAAALTGVWIGVAPPEGLSTAAQSVWDEDITLAFEPDLGTDLFPGEGG
ncbi:hypothetical protein [Roseovarius atlanticus]|uniref:hypothetical protein n=1 Tax=Roseovarius atlanticus TaxID=1641875 RepID=UPI001C96E99B|nr:hypothetical protein [Roseovarius atlanticus]MBY5987927.1 hypothetical protein [Roseovarius atlanticus]MBY6123318.1 hypothetical protein [Roseovarius atlanticus]MBY6147813.1 hypothetical protein [Roseovarius atlanticus]